MDRGRLIRQGNRMEPGSAHPQRCAMVFAHPGHELLAAGLIQRHRPHLLFLTRADSAGDAEREALARHGLQQLGLADRTTFLSVSDLDVYRWLLEGDVASFLQLRGRLVEWLDAIRPTILFGDAFELWNVVHDTARALLDSAWRECRRRFPCDNYELPLVCRTEPGPWNHRFQEFPSGPFETIHLNDIERKVKQSLADWMTAQRPEAEMVRPFFSLEREIFRRVSAERDYAKPPEGLCLHYDEWGRLQVQSGKYEKAILFAEHFVPLVRELPWLQVTTGAELAGSAPNR
ncbi:MAG: hypothetical protein ACJ8DQ_11575 [Xanthobacteraceae bacterium]